jgi:hypothetical protein
MVAAGESRITTSMPLWLGNFLGQAEVADLAARRLAERLPFPQEEERQTDDRLVSSSS